MAKVPDTNSGLGVNKDNEMSELREQLGALKGQHPKPSISVSTPFQWLTPHGETAALMRSKDWSKLGLGPPDTWPQYLKSAINTCLTSRTPMYLWWGPKNINIYNDAYIPIAGPLLHPKCFGEPAQEMWPDLWPASKSYLDQIYSSGIGLTRENVPFTLERRGHPEQAYFTFSLTPLIDESGVVHGEMAFIQETTASVEAQRQLELEKEKLTSLLMQAPLPMCTLEGPDHRFTTANAKYIELAGREVLGKPVREVFSEVEAGKFFEILDEVYKTGAPYTGREMHAGLIDSNGKTREVYIDFSYNPFRSPQGETLGVIVVVQDVTKFVLAQKALEESSRLFDAISEASPDFIFAKDRQGKMLFANPAVFQSLNKSEGEVIGHTDVEFLGESLGKPIMENDRRIMDSGRAEAVEENLWIDGKTRIYVTNKIPYQGANDKNIGLVGISRDITELRRAREEVESMALRYKALTDALPQLVWGCLSNGDADYLSHQWLEYTGFTEADQLGLNWLDKVIHPEDRERVLAHWMGAVQELHPYDIEYRIRRYDGVYHWFKTRGTPMRDQTGKIVYWFGTCTDIEDQRRNLEILKTINEVGGTISAELDLTRVVQLVTDAATKISGAQFGAFFYNVVSEKGEAYTLYTLSGAQKDAFSQFPMPRMTEIFGPTFRGEGVVRSDDITKDPRYGKNNPYFGMPKGHLPVVSYLAVPVLSRSGEVLGGLFFGHASEGVFKGREEEIIKGLASQAAIAIDNAKLYRQANEAISVRDEFLSIASHELRTPLTGMKLQAQMFNRALLRDPALVVSPAKVSQLVANIDRGLDRLGRLVGDMLDISRIQNGKLSMHTETIELSSLITEAIARLSPEMSNAGIEIRLALVPGLFAEVDRFRIDQVFTNMATNAIRYAPHAPVDVSLTLLGDRAVIRFQDHGPGIDKLDHVKVFGRFERLISANEVSGMGLGLYISKQIIEGHGGSIYVEGEKGHGACFVIELPLVKNSA